METIILKDSQLASCCVGHIPINRASYHFFGGQHSIGAYSLMSTVDTASISFSEENLPIVPATGPISWMLDRPGPSPAPFQATKRAALPEGWARSSESAGAEPAAGGCSWGLAWLSTSPSALATDRNSGERLACSSYPTRCIKFLWLCIIKKHPEKRLVRTCPVKPIKCVSSSLACPKMLSLAPDTQ